MTSGDPLQIKAFYTKKALKFARPWEADSPERLTAREFLSLVGVRGKGNNYRRAIVWLAMAAVGDGNDRIPGVLKEPFRDGVLRVHPFQSRSPNLVPVEYRIPVKDLTDKYAEQIRKLLSCRLGRVNDMIGPKTLAQLKFLSRRTGKSPSEIIAASVARMVEDAVGEERDRSLTHERPHIGDV